MEQKNICDTQSCCRDVESVHSLHPDEDTDIKFDSNEDVTDRKSDNNNNDYGKKDSILSVNSKEELIDELKHVQQLLELKKKADSPTDMDLLPKSYQILRQYPILSSRDHLNSINNDMSDDDDDDVSEYLENKSEFVRNGFGRMSSISAKSTGPGAENFNSVDEITIYGNITRKPATAQQQSFVMTSSIKTGETNNNVTTVTETGEKGVRQERMITSTPLDTSKIKPSSYMKASVQFPPYKSSMVNYDQWRKTSSPSPVNNNTRQLRSGSRSPEAVTVTNGAGVRTMVEHFNDEERRTGTKTVTRTITPTGELAVYASQSSVRFKMTSKSSKQQQQRDSKNLTLPRPKCDYDSDEGCRDLYPITTLKKTTPNRSISMREKNEPLRRSQCLPSPNFNIVHRDTEHIIEEDDCRESCTAPSQGYSVVVAIDFGTTYSGYAYSFTANQDDIYIMRKWEGDDPGINNQKTPTVLLLTPEQEFHSFGFTARDFYHDLQQREAKRWLYFDKFKMLLHHNKTLGRSTMISAANGASVSAMKIFSITLRYFKDHAIQELRDATGTKMDQDDIRWVITVPAIWRQEAKQFMREAAYQAEIASRSNPSQLVIALEPEAASVYCRKLKLNQLVPDRNVNNKTRDWNDKDLEDSVLVMDDAGVDFSNNPYLSLSSIVSSVDDSLDPGGQYMVVDCGGGTVDITVHEVSNKEGHIKEVFKATGGPYGSTSVDETFESLLCAVFGHELIRQYKRKRSAGFIDLMIAFESRKRSANPNKTNSLNVALPFSFIDFYRKNMGSDIGQAVNRFGSRDLKWSKEGMLRIEMDLMKQFFKPTFEKIQQHIQAVLTEPDIGNITHLFLVGGFAESPLLQDHIRAVFSDEVTVVIPQGVGVAVLKGAVMYGLDPGVITTRRAKLTYGIGVIVPFKQGIHPIEKLVVRGGRTWCMDVLDVFVRAGHSVSCGDTVIRSYRPAHEGQTSIILHIFSTEDEGSSSEVKFVSDSNVKLCGTLRLDVALPQNMDPTLCHIQVLMKFGDTEIMATAVDLSSGNAVSASVDFFTDKNPKYCTKL